MKTILKKRCRSSCGGLRETSRSIAAVVTTEPLSDGLPSTLLWNQNIRYHITIIRIFQRFSERAVQHKGTGSTRRLIGGLGRLTIAFKNMDLQVRNEEMGQSGEDPLRVTVLSFSLT